MRPQKVTDLVVMQGLMKVIRAKGYDGASLNDLAAATGLKKASLYHRFPGGKVEITEAVLNFVSQWLQENIVAVLSNSNQKPKIRLQKALNNIRALYQDGSATCIFRALSMDSGLELFGEQISNGFNTWLQAFQKIGMDLGLSKKQAHKTALDGLVKVQGSLIIAKALGNNKPFLDAIESIRNNYRI